MRLPRVAVARGEATTTTYTAIFAEDSGWIVGWVRERPGAILQEHTIEEARQSLKEAIQLILETRAECPSSRSKL